MEKILFKEEQRFTQWWLWLILIASVLAVLIPFVWGIYSQTVLDEPFGDQPMSTEGLVITGIFSVLLIVFIFLVVIRAKLKTKITNVGVFICYPPFVKKWKKFIPEEIEKYQIRTFKANREYGGYGMKKRRKTGQAYIISGNIGLQLYFKNGKKLLIGTQKKRAIAYAMGKLMDDDQKPIHNEKNLQNVESVFVRKAKKILIILAIEIIVAILIFAIIQIFK